MQIAIGVGIVLLGYILGSIPFGLLIVKLKTGKDIRTVESGRTGGTNAMRAAGFGAGLMTAVMDILKGALAVWIAQAADPQNQLLHVLAPIASIIGHNYSIFVIERDEHGKFLRLRGGAGGAPAVGGALGLWAPSLLIILPLAALVFFTLGYASVTTISIGLFATVYFAWQSALGNTPPIFVLYGLAALVLLLWALRPNIQKLISGEERVVSASLHGWIKARREKKNP
jgi:acyl phosphate:glycerol-3-phosphate acyltransferase